MKEFTNDQKIKNVTKRKILKIVIIILGILTIVFSLLTLLKEWNPLYAIFFFLLEVITSKYREKLDPKVKKDMEVHKNK